jgi:hypothetical protein
VIIDIDELSDDELLLLGALYNMYSQYEEDPVLKIPMQFYGLYDSSVGHSSTDDYFETKMHRAVGRLKNRTPDLYYNPEKSDIKELDKRSLHLLVLLARITDYTLYFDRNGNRLDSMWHISMSAGESAFSQLKRYGLMVTDSSGCGHWTELGQTTLSASLELDEFPLSDTT